jgi:UTP--glucose-1-phosphate uridylyltransferase
MLPIFSSDRSRALSIRPILQVIFEQLCEKGIEEFCFIVGRGKRAIVDHFTQDLAFVEKLDAKGKSQQAEDLRRFYHLISRTMITWVNQPEPLGFGHAVLMAATFTGEDDFVVHAGDTYIVSPDSSFLGRLMGVHEKEGADATLLLLRAPPTKGYGFAVVDGSGPAYKVSRVVEKPAKPPTNLAIMPIYAFGPAIMKELKKVRPGIGGEVQLTDGIQRLVDSGYKVQAVKLKENEIRLDIGTPELYWDALRLSRRLFRRVG